TDQRPTRQKEQLETLFRVTLVALLTGAAGGSRIFRTNTSAGGSSSSSPSRQGRGCNRADRHRQNAWIPDPGDGTTASTKGCGHRGTRPGSHSGTCHAG